MEFQQIVEEYAPSMYRLAYSYCLNRADAEDMVQEVFLKYLQRMPQCDQPEKLHAWLMTVTTNTCKNLLNSSWAEEGLQWALDHALVRGYPEEEGATIRPKKFMTRAELAEVLAQVITTT